MLEIEEKKGVNIFAPIDRSKENISGDLETGSADGASDFIAETMFTVSSCNSDIGRPLSSTVAMMVDTGDPVLLPHVCGKRFDYTTLGSAKKAYRHRQQHRES